MSSIKNLFKNTFIYGLATVLPRLLTVLLTPLLTKHLPTRADFGELSVIFSWMIIFNVLLTYGTETSFFRYFTETKDRSKVLGTALATLLGTTLLFVAIAYLSLDYIEVWTNKSSDYWKWVIGILAFDTLAVVPFAYMRAQGKAMKYAVIKMINVGIAVGCSALFLIWLQDIPVLRDIVPSDKIELFFIAFFGASFLTFFVVCKPYFSKWTFDMQLWKKMLRYGFPILIAGLAFAVNETFDKILLEWLLTDNATDQVGVYTACYRLAVGMTLFATAFKLGVEPFFFSEAKNEKAPELYAQITKMFVILGSIALLMYIILVDIIKVWLIDEAYFEAMDIVPLILIAYLFFGIYQSISVWYKVTDKTKYGAYISVLGAVLTIGLNLILIPQIGYMASAITTCAAYGFMMVASYIWSRKHFAIPYDVKNMLLYLTVAISFSLVFFYFLREELGIGSWSLYLVGIVMTAVLSGIIWTREKTFIKNLIKK
ncbi:MAG: oligosaccharide flippase family protein [Nonlabens sp.]|uniref:lipopolysaccharide biosynthesis protein n=1 Tax=Nonlabens sp. TaxID=1888209 RepID=UPI0035A5F35B